MNPPALLTRLDEIGRSLSQEAHALALIGLGSVGTELDRLDAWSDLDFFVIVEAGHKRAFLDDIGWLARLGLIAYAFANTEVGYKLLYADGIFCEFAIFEPAELEAIPFTAGRIVWKHANVPDSIGQPASPAPPRRSPEFLVGEALTNLYIGMGRDLRGERLSALRFIQGYAVDRLVELAVYIDEPQAATRDMFANERRFEKRHPVIPSHAAEWMQGYHRNQESALAILTFLEEHFEVNAAIAGEIRKRCA